MKIDRVELAIGIALAVGLVGLVALLWAGAPSPEERAMQCMADNGWADLACERFAGLPAGWVWPR